MSNTEAERHAVRMQELLGDWGEAGEHEGKALALFQAIGSVGYQLALLNDNMERLVVEARNIGWRVT